MTGFLMGRGVTCHRCQAPLQHPTSWVRSSHSASLAHISSALAVTRPLAHPVRAQGKEGGLLSGLGKLFQGADKGRHGEGGQRDQQQQEKKAVPMEVFMMSSMDEKPEHPPFQTVTRTKEYDLRFYQVYPVVEMQYEQRQEGYAALGGFIDGDNDARVRFVYTQPVTMKYENGAQGTKVMQMYLGSRRGAVNKSESVAALPAPTDPSVRVTVAGGELVAVRRFEGYITPTTAESARQKLLAALKRDGVKLSAEAEAGGFRVGQYGAVYQLEGRINELYIKVAV